MEPRERDCAQRARLRSVADGLGIDADLEHLRRLEPPPQSSDRRQQIMNGALEQAASLATAAPTPGRTQRGVRAPMLAIAALSAAALFAIWLDARRTPGEAPQGADGSQQLAAPALQLTSGRIEVDGALLDDGARILAGTRASTMDEPAQLVFADASVLYAQPRTTLVYAGDSGREERVELQHGGVSLQVNARARHRPLVVETAELSARVVGTRFDLMREAREAGLGTTVRVREGLVRVVSKRDGVRRLLAAGEHITVAASAAASSDEPAPVSSTSTNASAAIKSAASPPTRRHETRAPHALSDEIRRQLKSGEVDAARRLLRRAERERTVGGVELALLQAEADLAEHRHERAKSRYLAIVAEHAGTPEAELSLFAAAQLSRGRAGVDLLQRYLARYPNGRFAREAQRLLQALDRP